MANRKKPVKQHKGTQIITAPSILGLKPVGVEKLAEALLACNLAVKLGTEHPVIDVPTLNERYSDKRDPETNCLNSKAIIDFSLVLGKSVVRVVNDGYLALVLGGDCSILLGIMSGLKAIGSYGLLFLDAHADFYEPEKSLTGELADMDLAIITGYGPAMLTNINGLGPYVKEEHVIHIGQRDEEEARRYGSRDISQTAITCFNLASIEQKGMDAILARVMQQVNQLKVDGLWIHFDTDVLADAINPAVDYRLPGGLAFEQVEQVIKGLFSTGRVAGMSITIFNPALDQNGHIAKNITESLAMAFNV